MTDATQAPAAPKGPLTPLRGVLPKRFRRDVPVIPVVRLSGAIGMGSPLRPSLTLQAVAGPLEKAFSMRHAPAVALIVNSPGGSAVQSHLIFTRIRALAEEKEKPVFVYVEDVAASGGYMIACAGDQIVADASSIVGSIGVIAASFGFDKAIEKLGIDRRVYTAGPRKMTLDPFQPEKAEDVRRLRALQRDVHQSFIDLVRARRGDVLVAPDKALFTGEFWSGSAALPLGLVDRLGDLRSDLKARYGKETILRLISARRGFSFGRFGLPDSNLGGPPLVSGDDLIGAAEDRALWARYGL